MIGDTFLFYLAVLGLLLLMLLISFADVVGGWLVGWFLSWTNDCEDVEHDRFER